MASSNPPISLELLFPIDEKLLEALNTFGLEEHVIEPLESIHISEVDSYHASLHTPSTLAQRIRGINFP